MYTYTQNSQLDGTTKKETAKVKTKDIDIVTNPVVLLLIVVDKSSRKGTWRS